MVTLPYDFDLLCIGSGPAGQYAVIQATKLGTRVAFVERRRTMGGVWVETGTIPSNIFREAVLSFNSVTRHFEQHVGYRYRICATAAQLLARVKDVRRPEVEIVVDQLRQNDVTLFHGNAAFRDPHTMTVTAEEDTRSITVANILIALGTAPPLVDDVRFDGAAILNDDGVPRLRRLPRHVADVADDVIGIDYAFMFAASNINATTVDKRTGFLELLDSEIVETLIREIRSRHVSFHRRRHRVSKSRIDLGFTGPTRLLSRVRSGSRMYVEHFRVDTYAILEITKTGRPEHTLTEKQICYETGLARDGEIACGQILGDDRGVIRWLFHREDRWLLDVHSIGTFAIELIHIDQAVPDLGGGLDDFLHTVFNYPTLAECDKVVALDAHNKLGITAFWMPTEAI